MKLYSFFRQVASLKCGDSVTVTRTITQLELDLFAQISGDHNPIHKASSLNKEPLVHGAFLNSIVSGIIGTKLPGPGSMVLSQNFTFPNKCFVDEPVEFLVQLLEVRKILKVRYECKQKGCLVFEGEAKLLMNKL